MIFDQETRMLLEQALPFVEEGEEFNKPSRRGLSKAIRAALVPSHDAEEAMSITEAQRTSE